MEEAGKKESQFCFSSSEKHHQASGQSEETVLSDSDLEILSELIRLCRQFWCPILHFLLNYALTFNIYHADILFIDHVEGIKLFSPFLAANFQHLLTTTG